MTNYRIVCTEQTGGTPHGHITAVGIEPTPGSADRRLTVREVYGLMDRGHSFYTYGGGQRASVEKWTCCGIATLRSGSDATPANNLDSLRLCQW